MTKPKRKPRAACHPAATTWLYLVGCDATDKRPAQLKIGMTCDPRKRLLKHGKRTFNGTLIEWRHICTSGPRFLIAEIERAVLDAFARIGTSKGRHWQCEDFSGITREQALPIVRAVAMRVRDGSDEFIARRRRFADEAKAWRAFRAELYGALDKASEAA